MNLIWLCSFFASYIYCILHPMLFRMIVLNKISNLKIRFNNLKGHSSCEWKYIWFLAHYLRLNMFDASFYENNQSTQKKKSKAIRGKRKKFKCFYFLPIHWLKKVATRCSHQSIILIHLFFPPLTNNATILYSESITHFHFLYI